MNVNYFDLSHIIKLPSIQVVLKETPHIIFDQYKVNISSFNSKAASKNKPVAIIAQKIILGYIIIESEKSNTLQVIIEHEFYRLQKENHKLKNLFQNDIIAKDVDILLHGSMQNKNLKHILQDFFRKLRSHVPFEKGSIYLSNYNNLLLGHTELDQNGEVSEISSSRAPLNEDTVGSLAFRNNQIYVINDPSTDPLFTKKENHDVPKNIAIFPIYYHNYALGILNVTNLFKTTEQERLIEIINKFMVTLSHILYHQQMNQFLELKRQESDDLQHYVSDSVYQQLKSNEKNKLSDPIKKNVVCLFADIRSFTKISEKMDPATLVKALNVYFELLTPIIQESGGTIDKFVGDMISCFWNAPHDVKNAELVAVKCALKMQQLMVHKVAPYWRDHGVKHMGIGIGIHSGPCLVGHIGSKGFNNYTVLGPHVNKAQWLESLARPSEVWISEELYKIIKQDIHVPQRQELALTYNGKKAKAWVYKPEDYPDYTKFGY